MNTNEKYILACRTADINLLKESISEGVDVNQLTDLGDETFFERMIYVWGSCWDFYEEGGKENTAPRWTDEHMIEFANLLVDNGFNLNRTYQDGRDTYDFYWSVAKWSRSLPLLEALFKRGMSANHLDGMWSMLDKIDDDIFAEGACGYPDLAKWLYDAVRLSVAYGALPGKILGKIYEEGQEEYYEAAIRLDADFFVSVAKTKPLTEIKPDKLMVRYGKYGYPKEFYFESDKFQARMIAALDKIIPLIGIENLDKHVLEECVDQQFEIVLEHLLCLGANPNVNCFTTYYSYVISSALYTAIHKDFLYDAQKLVEKPRACDPLRRSCLNPR